MHLRLTQHCFRMPGPPYFGLSRQCLQTPHSFAMHPEHLKHCLRAFPIKQ